MRVIKFISYSEAEKRKESFGGLGGWFEKGHRWKDYVDDLTDEHKSYAEAIREYVIAHKIWMGGDSHQNIDEGAPLFEDDTVALFSYRAWGDIMAAIWSTELNRDFSYMNFYMDTLLPDFEEVKGNE